MATAASLTAIQKVYIAYYGRPADPIGLDYWATKLDTANGNLSTIINAFGTSAEATTRFAGQSTATMINNLYLQMFNRAAEPAGLSWWVQQVTAGNYTIATVMQAVLGGAQNADANVIAGKLASADLYTAAMDTTAEILAYQGTAAADAGRAFLAPVGATAVTAAAADAAVATMVAGAPPEVVGQTYTLATGVDNFTGGAGNDVFIADNSGTNTTGLADKLDGGAGTDSLTIYGFATGDGTPQISNIENIVLDNSAAGSTISLANATGVSSVTVQNAVGATDTTVASGVAVTLVTNADKATAQVVDYGGTATSASLTLNGVSTNTTVDVEAQGAKVTTLNIATTGAASTVGQLEVDAKMATVNITGDKNLTITDAVEEAVEVINASAFTGKLSVSTANQATLPDALVGTVDVTDITITGGSGNDTIDISANAADNEVSVNGGAGDDKVVIVKTATAAYGKATSTNAGDSIVGGDGTDTLSVNGDLTADLTGVVSGFEMLEFTASAAGTNVATTKLGISQFRLTTGTTDAVLTGLAADSIVTISDDGSDLAATINTDTTADSLTVVLESTGTVTGSAITATSYETLNITSTKLSTDASTVANKLAGVTATSATKVVLTGSTALTGGTITTKAAATIDAGAYTGDLTAATFGASVKSYLGGTGKDEISLIAGDLKQGNTFAGGAGTDKLTVTASASQDLGIVGMTGFETLAFTASGSNVADFRNVTDLTTLSVTASAGTDDLTLNRLNSDTTLSFATSFDQVVTTINIGTTQKVAVTAASTIVSLTLDSGTTSLTVTSDDGDATANEAIGAFTAISGTSLTSIIVNGKDQVSLGTLSTTVTSVDASTSTGALALTASATKTSIIGSQVADSITGGGAVDTIQGGKGNDTLSGGAGADIYVFEATGALNGADTITFVAAAGGDVLNFKNFLSGGAVDQNGGAGTAITAYTIANVSDVNITNKVATYADATDANIDTITEIAALIQGSGDAFSLTSAGKTILVTGDPTGTNVSRIWLIDDTLDSVNGTISATDVVLVGTTSAGVDIDTLITTNFAFA